MGAGEDDVCFGDAGEGGAEFEEGGAEVLGSFGEGDDCCDGYGCVLEELRAERGPVRAHADGLLRYIISTSGSSLLYLQLCGIRSLISP